MVIIYRMTSDGPHEAGRVTGEKLSGDENLLRKMAANLGNDRSEAAWLKRFHGSYLWAELGDLSTIAGDNIDSTQKS